MTVRDLRDFINKADDLGEICRVNGAHWDLEIGGITEIAQNQINGPAVLFDHIVDHQPGFRILVNSLGSANRSALVMGLPTGKSFRELLPIWRKRSRELTPIPPRFVDHGPILENVLTGNQIDMLKFPTPKWHHLDGGRYIGTGTVDIIKDPDSDWVNLGCYRAMVVDQQRISLYISPGKHGRILEEKYFARGEPMPVAMTFGQDPTIFLAASVELPYGSSEYDYAGALKGQPIEVIRGRVTGLPIPATAEIAVEGFIYPGERVPEGPFGEWTGYYGSSSRSEPVLKVETLYHRNDPIITGSPPTKPPAEFTAYRVLWRSATIWDQLERAGVPDVTGVWTHEAGGTRLFTAVSIKQRYPGHARQAGHVAAMCHAGAYLGRYVVVCDDDVDVTNLHYVVWAMCTRADPERSIDIIKRAWSGPLDPAIKPGEKGFNSRLIIDATRPWEWRDQFPPVCFLTPEERKKIIDKWGEITLGVKQLVAREGS